MFLCTCASLSLLLHVGLSELDMLPCEQATTSEVESPEAAFHLLVHAFTCPYLYNAGLVLGEVFVQVPRNQQQRANQWTPRRCCNILQIIAKCVLELALVHLECSRSSHSQLFKLLISAVECFPIQQLGTRWLFFLTFICV